MSTLGHQSFAMPEFCRAIATRPVIGMLNIGGSFVFAFRLALRAQDFAINDRLRL